MAEETYSHVGPQCPHCGRQYVADEQHYYDEQRYTAETCDECGKPFSVSVAIETTWTCDAVKD